MQELDQANGREPRVDEREVVVERRDQAHQVHHLGAAVPVRQVVREHLGVGEERRELLDARGVRAVAAADEQGLAVEPERVAAVDRAGRLDPSGDRDAGLREIVLERRRLAQPLVLARAEQHGAALADEQRVVGVDRVGVARSPSVTITSAPASSRISRKRLVLGGGGGEVRLGAPAVLAPAHGVGRLRRAHEHAPERLGHRAGAVVRASWKAEG